mmetsp:Transcript_17801/g.47429  ORF Transcript_17801/g.47429 Transcript_17801/m.47429 type:complete len:326 (-) Transcript_17801:325-1302(-)
MRWGRRLLLGPHCCGHNLVVYRCGCWGNGHGQTRRQRFHRSQDLLGGVHDCWRLLLLDRQHVRVLGQICAPRCYRSPQVHRFAVLRLYRLRRSLLHGLQGQEPFEDDAARVDWHVDGGGNPLGARPDGACRDGAVPLRHEHGILRRWFQCARLGVGKVDRRGRRDLPAAARGAAEHHAAARAGRCHVRGRLAALDLLEAKQERGLLRVHVDCGDRAHGGLLCCAFRSPLGHDLNRSSAELQLDQCFLDPSTVWERWECRAAVREHAGVDLVHLHSGCWLHSGTRHCPAASRWQQHGHGLCAPLHRDSLYVSCDCLHLANSLQDEV